MGGNALSTKTVRVTTDEYTAIVSTILTVVAAAFPSIELLSIPQLSEKSSHGDIDLIVAGTNEDALLLATSLASGNEVIFNKRNPVVSFAYTTASGNIQVDLISVPSRCASFAMKYFAYGDLGMIIGKVARKLGLKYGHCGLTLPVVDRHGNVLDHLLLTLNHQIALSVLGFDPVRWNAGFSNSTDLVAYCYDNELVDCSILQNTKSKDRTRANKRATYQFISNNLTALVASRVTDWDFHKTCVATQFPLMYSLASLLSQAECNLQTLLLVAGVEHIGVNYE